MRLHNRISIVCAIAVFGCSPAPKAVFVDLNAIEVRDQAQLPVVPLIGEVASTVILPRVAIMPPLRSVTIQDLAADQIGEARRLIAEDRQRALTTLTRQLKEARQKEIDTQRIAAEQEVAQRLAEYWSRVYDELYAVFKAYALERGPTELRLELLKSRKPELFPSRSTFTEMVTGPSMAEENEAEIRERVIQIAGLDAKYAVDANRILSEAQVALKLEREAIRQKYAQMTAQAEKDAAREAQDAIRRVSASTDLNLGQNRSVTISPVAGRTLTVPGSESAPGEFVGLNIPGVTEGSERRRSLEAQLEIWLKTKGYVRSRSRSDANDSTEEFDSWRKTHRLGL